ncbi:MFS transporter [Nocardioides daphniae]|uniref:MFS transporter n=1 Tax=Nocardioides daphniae TaxID=402297 RepID=A0ABQ1PZS7_9ACTN|nr:MFS transporter [Nocardioides daphniae]GGD08284.1 MFS transporter [Nocardioides daphniae]
MLDRLRALRMDTTPVREHRDFRLLLVSGTVFLFGAMITYVAIPYQVYALTGSNLMVGMIGLVELVPLVVFGLWGGALADHFDRRRLLITAGLAQAVLVAVLAVNAFLDEPKIWLIFVLGALLTSASALQRPSREALMPRTVRHDQIAAAQALTSFGAQMAMLAGPLVGGLLIAYVGIGWCFVIDVVGITVAALMFVAMKPYPHTVETTPPSLRSIADGIAYGVRRRDLLGTYAVDLAAMFLAMPVVLFPALAEEVYGDPEVLGLLYAAGTVGAVLATVTSGWITRVHLHGRAIVVAAMVYGGFIALAGLAPNLWVALTFFTLAGAADMISGIFRGTVWNQTIPEHMRGRLAGIEMLSYSLGPQMGQVRGGFVADAWSPRAAVVSGGLACVGGVAVTALWLRDFWTYDARTDEHAVAERESRIRVAQG